MGIQEASLREYPFLWSLHFGGGRHTNLKETNESISDSGKCYRNEETTGWCDSDWGRGIRIRWLEKASWRRGILNWNWWARKVQSCSKIMWFSPVFILALELECLIQCRAVPYPVSVPLQCIGYVRTSQGMWITFCNETSLCDAIIRKIKLTKAVYALNFPRLLHLSFLLSVHMHRNYIIIIFLFPLMVKIKDVL